MYISIENVRYPLRRIWRQKILKPPSTQREYNLLKQKSLSNETIFSLTKIRPYRALCFSLNGATTNTDTYLAAITIQEHIEMIIPFASLSPKGKKIAQALHADGFGIACRIDENEISHKCLVPIRGIDQSVPQLSRGQRYHSK